MDIQLQNSTAADQGALDHGFSWLQGPILPPFILPGAEAGLALADGRGGRIETRYEHEFKNGVSVGVGISCDPRRGKCDEGRIGIGVKI